jgi:hypothetical protein
MYSHPVTVMTEKQVVIGTLAEARSTPHAMLLGDDEDVGLPAGTAASTGLAAGLTRRHSLRD